MFGRKNYGSQCCPEPCCPQPNCGEIVEPMISKCVENDYYCEVPHICPINTHTINRVHYVHTYTPKYSCTEETQIINNDCGSCCDYVNR